jgi:hypothetical protein
MSDSHLSTAIPMPEEQLRLSVEPLLCELLTLANSPRHRFKDLSKHQTPNLAGLYILYQEEPLDILYVGKALLKGKSSTACDGLRFRIMENHLGKRGDDNFVRYIQQHFKLSSRPEACEHIARECSVSWIEVSDARKLFLLEHFAIAAFQPKLNRG